MGCCSSGKGQEPEKKEGNKDSPTNQNKRLSLPQKSHNLRQRYKFSGKVIGAGNFGKIMLAENKFHGQQVAIKFISKESVRDQMHEIIREVQILQSLDHPNIVKYHETYEDEKYIYLIMEYCDGGELFEAIMNKANELVQFTEEEAKGMMRKLLHAISHCHSNGIAHRDIKPENILFSKKGVSGEIKLIDFGLATTSNKGNDLKTIVGTPYYLAPEVLRGHYTFSCDVWSLGVLLYILLSGYLPFGGESTQEVLYKVTAFTEPSFSNQVWQNISPAAKDLIYQMLRPDPKDRITAAQALNTTWFLNSESSPASIVINPQIFVKLQSYQVRSKLQREAMSTMVKLLKESEISGLRDIFRKLDQDNTGYISFKELENAMQEGGYPGSASDIKQIINNVDYEGNGKINYTEFIVATVSVKEFLTEERMWYLFKYFDTDDSGYITHNNIREVMSESGKNLDDKEIVDIITMHDIETNGKISFKEFKVMMQAIGFKPEEEHVEKIAAQPRE